MVNYQNGKVYCIRSNQTEKVYIGSTTQSLCRRLAGHKAKYKFWLNNPKDYTSSFELIKFEDSYIELVENCPCNNKEELYKREGEIMRQYNNRVNMLISGRTDKQYREDNKEIIKEKDKIKYENNKEKIKERSKERYENIGKQIIVCECNINTTIDAQSNHRKSKKHLEILSNKENKCECGLILQHTSPSHITRHNKSKIHIEIMNNIFYKKIYNFIYS
jgi:hypothetical protein